MSTVEDQLRTALRDRAEDFTIEPDAWERLPERRRAGRRRRRGPRRRWMAGFGAPAAFVAPVAAAAAVAGIVVAALLVTGGSSRTGSPSAAGAQASSGHSALSSGPQLAPSSPGDPARAMLENGGMLQQYPALSAIGEVTVPWIGKTAGGAAERVAAWLWAAKNSPARNPGSRQYYSDVSLQLCYDIVNVSTGESYGSCSPMPELETSAAGVITGSGGVGTNQTIMIGEAAPQVTSVTAMLPDGRAYPGTVTMVSGMGGKIWTVGYPWTTGVSFTKGAHLVFTDATGKKLAVVEP